MAASREQIVNKMHGMDELEFEQFVMIHNFLHCLNLSPDNRVATAQYMESDITMLRTTYNYYNYGEGSFFH